MGGMPRPEWAEYIVESAHADAAATGALIAVEAQRSRRVQLEAARRQIEAAERQTNAVRETALATQHAVADAADRQVAAQRDTTHAVADLGASMDALNDRLGDSLDLGFLRVQQTVSEGLETLERNLNVIAGITHGGFELVGQRVIEQTAVLGDIATMTAQPLTTAAAEHYRRGVMSLGQGWLDDAVPELELAIEKDRTNPAPRYALGVAQAALNEPAAAFASLVSAIKYSTADERWGSLAASAAILLRSVATPDQADEVGRALDSALRVAPTCAELLLIRAVHRGTRGDLIHAFTLAPELAVVAIQAGVPGAEEAAEIVASDPSSPVHARREIQRLITASGDDGFGPNLEPADIPQAMIGYDGWVRTALPTVVEHARVGIAQRLDAAAISVSSTRAAADLARLTLASMREDVRELERQREGAVEAVARAEAAAAAYRMLPAATATIEHTPNVVGGFQPFLRPFVALIVTVLLMAFAGANPPIAFIAGTSAVVFGILFVVWLVKAFGHAAERRAVAKREAVTAQQIRDHHARIAQDQSERARDRAERELSDVTRARQAAQQAVATATDRIVELDADLQAAEIEHRRAQEDLSRLTFEADLYQRPILALLPQLAPARIHPLGYVS
ncbi:hypothetical protein SRABI121_02745 [Microbacterium sp. Bi121]|nr:hypothetical protein SRABI121_02745 [Microbacterium sp. Bi121]